MRKVYRTNGKTAWVLEDKEFDLTREWGRNFTRENFYQYCQESGVTFSDTTRNDDLSDNDVIGQGNEEPGQKETESLLPPWMRNESSDSNE